MTREQLEAAVGATTFDKLKSQEIESGFQEAAHRDRPFFRRGIAGAWRDELLRSSRPDRVRSRTRHDAPGIPRGRQGAGVVPLTSRSVIQRGTLPLSLQSTVTW